MPIISSVCSWSKIVSKLKLKYTEAELLTWPMRLSNESESILYQNDCP